MRGDGWRNEELQMTAIRKLFDANSGQNSPKRPPSRNPSDRNQRFVDNRFPANTDTHTPPAIQKKMVNINIY